jgi:hypothetical protein
MGLQGLCALSTLEFENLAIVPTKSPCNLSLCALNGHLRGTVRHPGIKVLLAGQL